MDDYFDGLLEKLNDLSDKEFEELLIDSGIESNEDKREKI